MTQSNKDLEATYGPTASTSEVIISPIPLPKAPRCKCDYMGAAPLESIGIKYVAAPDVPIGFVDFVVPGDVNTISYK